MIRRLRAALGGRWAAIAAVICLVILSDYAWLGFGRVIDQRAGDVLLRFNAARRPQSDKIVIIDIDQRSLEQMNDLAGSWPWPRSVHADLIEYIARQHPRAIAFDVLFNEVDVYRPEQDTALANAVAQNPNVFLAMTLNADGQGAWVHDMPKAVQPKALTSPPHDARIPLMMPLAVLSQPTAMRGGLINFEADSDKVGRHHLQWLDRADWRFFSLPARTLTDTGQRLPSQQSILLNWRRNWHHVSYSDVYLDSLREHPVRPPGEFSGKIVVVGTSAPGLQDLRLTPMGSTYPGVEVLATAIDNLASDDWLREQPRAPLAGLALALCVLVTGGFAFGVNASRIGYAMLAASFATIAATWLALISGVFIPVFGALTYGWACYIAAGAAAYLQERAQRLRTFGMFKRFLDPRIVSELIERGEIDYRTNAQTREITVLFSDIRGFTVLSERAQPEAVVALLNQYFSRQVEVIFRHGGTLDKFIGDCIMAFWGAPTAYPDHAERAVVAAHEMSLVLEDLRKDLGELGAGLEIGIGIHTGNAVVGFIGSNDRLDYTVIGDTVNLASRIEGLTKGIARILVSEATRNAIGSKCDWTDHGLHQVKGREALVHLFEPGVIVTPVEPNGE